MSLKRELELISLYVVFFMLFFTTFTLFHWLMEGAFDNAPFRLGYNLIEALVMSKAILLGQKLHLGERFENRSLIVPTVYKTAIFAVFVTAFSVVEEFAMGHLKGKKFGFIWQEFLETGVRHTLAKVLIMVFVLFFFFAFLELGRVFGKEKLFNLFFRRNRSS